MNHKKGKKLEEYVAEKLKGIYKYSRPTIASGATPAEKGDCKSPYFLIECKIRNTKSFSFKEDTWLETKGMAAESYKDPVYIIQNKNGHRVVLLDFEDWISMVIELIELRKQTGTT